MFNNWKERVSIYKSREEDLKLQSHYCKYNLPDSGLTERFTIPESRNSSINEFSLQFVNVNWRKSKVWKLWNVRSGITLGAVHLFVAVLGPRFSPLASSFLSSFFMEQSGFSWQEVKLATKADQWPFDGKMPWAKSGLFWGHFESV